MGWDWMGGGWNGMGWDGMGWGGMAWDGMGWDGMRLDHRVMTQESTTSPPTPTLPPPLPPSLSPSCARLPISLPAPTTRDAPAATTSSEAPARAGRLLPPRHGLGRGAALALARRGTSGGGLLCGCCCEIVPHRLDLLLEPERLEHASVFGNALEPCDLVVGEPLGGLWIEIFARRLALAIILVLALARNRPRLRDGRAELVALGAGDLLLPEGLGLCSG